MLFRSSVISQKRQLGSVTSRFTKKTLENKAGEFALGLSYVMVCISANQNAPVINCSVQVLYKVGS